MWAYNKKLSEKQPKIIKRLHHQFTVNAWRKNGVEVREYGAEKWINQGHLQEKRNLSNISDRTQYYSDEFKKNEIRNTRAWKLSTL